jgi:hypothetical protein
MPLHTLLKRFRGIAPSSPRADPVSMPAAAGAGVVVAPGTILAQRPPVVAPFHRHADHHGPMSASTLWLLLAVAGHGAAVTCTSRSGAVTVPLVELYTAEGCSSCPPADRWLSRQSRGTDANWLAFHVDYWDGLGWRDRFAARAHSQRQRDRAWAWSSATVYTPQVMLGPAIHAPWRSPPAFAAALRKARTPARAGVALELHAAGGGWSARLAAVPVPVARGTAAQLWLARWIDGQATAVRGGENRGALLRHDRVVQGLWGPWPLGAEAMVRQVSLPPAPGRWGVVAFVQDARGDTLQSLGIDSSTCRPATTPR